MSGKPKQGIDFAGWNTDIFENDTKIDALLDAQGATGFYIYFYLCQKAYASDGYFYRWSYADSTTTACKMGGRIRSETVRATVGTCCKVGLFDKRLLECEGILTSRGIQRRFIAAIQKRSYRAVNRRFWLLDEPETAAGKITFLKEDFPDVGDSSTMNHHVLPEDAHVLPEDTPNSKVKESKDSSGGSNARTREDELGRVMGFYLDHFPLPSENVRSGLRDYTELLSADVVLRVLQYAIDEHKTGWGYILTILQRYHRDGLTTIGAVEEDERRHRERKKSPRHAAPKKKSFLDMYKEALENDAT